MELYLAQHGRAVAAEEDPDRPLTAGGREETERVARALAAAGVRAGAVWHSGKTRARQTAEIFAAHLAPEVELERREWLGPLDDPRKAVEAARELGEDVLLVGHKPYMSRLPSLLLTGNPEADAVEIRPSGVVALAARDGAWCLLWSLPPELTG